MFNSIIRVSTFSPSSDRSTSSEIFRKSKKSTCGGFLQNQEKRFADPNKCLVKNAMSFMLL